MRTALLLTAAVLLVAGCAQPSATSTFSGVRLNQDSDTVKAVSPTQPAFNVVADLHRDSQDPNGTDLFATAVPPSNYTYQVETGCTDPWNEKMENRQGETVQTDQPEAHCLAFALTDWTQPTVYSSSWDGKLWDDASQSRVTAPAGDYIWTVTFTAYKDGQPVPVDLAFRLKWG